MYKEKGSKFLAFAYPVETEAEIAQKLESLRKEYFDARHHCYAYILGAEQNKFRTFDDGEPSHSAGDPILGQLRSNNLTNVLIVVVRYFGGTKLGVGGLIAAYRAAAEDALANTSIVEKDVVKSLHISYDFASTPEVMRMVKTFDLAVREQSFQDHCTLSAEYRLKDEAKLMEKVTLLKQLGHIR